MRIFFGINHPPGSICNFNANQNKNQYNIEPFEKLYQEGIPKR